jgi:hypothetical protein
MVVAGAASREWNGVPFPRAGTWVLDAAHTTIDLEVEAVLRRS